MGRGTEPIAKSTSLGARAFEGSLYSIGASLFTLGLGFFRAVALARLLLPEHFGVVALAIFYIGLAMQLRGFDLDSALIHRQEPDEAFLGTYFSLRAGTNLAVSLLLWGIAPFLQRAYPQMANLGKVFAVLVGAYFIANLSQAQETLLRKRLAFRSLAITDVLASLTMTVASVGAAYLGWGIWALVVERFSGLGMRFLLTWGPFRCWQPKLRWKKEEVRWFWEFGKPSWVASNLSYLLDRFDDFWVGTALGKVSLGYYAKAYEFARYPRRVFANPLASVFGPIFAQVQNDRLQLSRYFYRSAHFVVRTGFLIAGIFALLMPEFIHLIIGEKWAPVLWPFRLMMVYIALDALILLMTVLILALGKPQELRRARTVQALFFLPAVILGARWGGINGVALAADGMLLIGAWRLYGPLKEMVDFSLIKLMGWPVVALLLAWVAGMGVERALVLSPWLSAGLKAIVFLGVFMGILFVGEREDYFRGIAWIYEAIRHRRGGGE